ncbi:hypothetical protein [Comamonas sp.]|uniref:hypothetical protein n=1 Tax=Comamonas sp. TaxID=34028 RepID=UPI0028A8CAD0|nr:hypothetical protein [Comamonas sp.]
MAAQRPLPLYTSRSTVRALKIKAVTYSREPLEDVPRGEAFITPADGRYAPFWVDEPWAMKNRPQTATNLFHLQLNSKACMHLLNQVGIFQPKASKFCL